LGIPAPDHLGDLSPVLGLARLPGVSYGALQLGSLLMEQRMILTMRRGLAHFDIQIWCARRRLGKGNGMT
jgi:hypothetical protein